MMESADLFLHNIGQLCTLAGHGGGPAAGSAQGEVGAVAGGALAAYQGQVVAAGPEDKVRAAIGLPLRGHPASGDGAPSGNDAGPHPGEGGLTAGATIVDAGGRLVTPGLVDPHTHLCFAGWRADEFGLRVQGAAYLDILKAGGGILNTVQATRAATEDELVADLQGRLDDLLLLGTTTVEIKSGYGLALGPEIKQLQAIRRAAETAVQDVVPTFLGAHAVPPEFKGQAQVYAQMIASAMLPAVASAGLAKYVDVFCEDGAFDLAQTRLILESAKRFGLGLKVHADEVVPLGGARLAAELGAASADHLVVTPQGDFEALREAKTVACLLPATSFFLMKTAHAPGRGLIEAGVPVALATDCNPGTQPGESLPLVMAIACLSLRLSPAEALTAVTLNAAHAIGLGERVGSLEPGKQADFVVWDCPTYEHLPYRMGTNLVETVVKRGEVVVVGGRRV